MGFWSDLGQVAENFFNSVWGSASNGSQAPSSADTGDPYGTAPDVLQQDFTREQVQFFTQRYGSTTVSNRDGVITFNPPNDTGDHYDTHVLAAPTLTSGRTFRGGAGNDEISAADGADAIFGGGGVNALFGNRGDDKFYGASGGRDWMSGGKGNDNFYVGAGDTALMGWDRDTAHFLDQAGTSKAINFGAGDKFDFVDAADVIVKNIVFGNKVALTDDGYEREVVSATFVDPSAGPTVNVKFFNDDCFIEVMNDTTTLEAGAAARFVDELVF